MKRVPERFKVGVRRYEPRDAEALAEFQRRMYGPDARQLDPVRFQWMFEDHPLKSPEGVGLWVCERDGKIVGHQAEMRFDLKIGSSVHRAAWTVDLMVDPEYQMKGVGPALVEAQLDASPVSFAVAQPAAAVKSYQRSGWRDAGTFTMYNRPLTGDFVRYAPGTAAHIRLLWPILGAAIRTVDALAAGVLRLAGLSLMPAERFDERLNEVWERAHRSYEIVSVRDLQAVGYRLDERFDRGDLQRHYLMRGTDALGWIAVRDKERWGGTASVVIDFFAPPRWTIPLLLLAGSAARRRGAFALVAPILARPLDRRLRLSGFFPRAATTSPMKLLVAGTVRDPLLHRLDQARDWFATAGESDHAY